MMVKKKISEIENLKAKDEIETTENKENKVETSTETTSQEEHAENILTAEKPSETEEGKEPVSDKKPSEDNQLTEKLAEMQDKYLRLSAEFDNYRKRTLREKMEMTKYAGEDLLKALLPLMDDFERALKHIESSENCKGIKEGIDLIYVKFSEFLKQQGLKEIEALDKVFNVDLHDAVSKVPVNDEDKKGKIVEVILKGYYLQDKVLRHSKVVIGE